MTDRLRSLSDDELGAALTTLGHRIAWPVAGDLPVAVGHAIRRSEGRVVAWPGSPVRSRRRTVAILVAALLALAGAAVAAKLVVDLGAVTIREVPRLPTASPTAEVGTGSLGRPLTLDQAAAIAGFAPRLPAGVGSPDAVWAQPLHASFDAEPATAIVLAWRPAPDLPAIPGSPWGLVLMEFRGQAEVASKLLMEGRATISPASVDGHDAYVVSGEHELDLLDDGQLLRFTSRGLAVLWSDGTVTLRLETGLPRAAALALADGTS